MFERLKTCFMCVWRRFFLFPYYWEEVVSFKVNNIIVVGSTFKAIKSVCLRLPYRPKTNPSQRLQDKLWGVCCYYGTYYPEGSNRLNREQEISF